MTHRVLVVDDEPDWVATYRQWLEPDGYELRGCSTVEAAVREATNWRPHVAIIDQKLEGRGGPDLGLSLIGRMAAASPATRSVLVTAFATREAVERAFRSGASDYLEKTEILEPLLRVKLRELALNAEHALQSADLTSEIRAAWDVARTETNSQKKGAALELTTRLLFQSVPGLAYARSNPSNETEEIDVLVTNQSREPLLSRQGDFFVVECKNWSTSVGTPVTARLRDKVDKRYGRARLGICVSMGGFAESVRTDLLAERRGEILIVPIDGRDIEAWIDSPNRETWLVERISKMVVEG